MRLLKYIFSRYTLQYLGIVYAVLALTRCEQNLCLRAVLNQKKGPQYCEPFNEFKNSGVLYSLPCLSVFLLNPGNFNDDLSPICRPISLTGSPSGGIDNPYSTAQKIP